MNHQETLVKESYTDYEREQSRILRDQLIQAIDAVFTDEDERAMQAMDEESLAEKVNKDEAQETEDSSDSSAKVKTRSFLGKVGAQLWLAKNTIGDKVSSGFEKLRESGPEPLTRREKIVRGVSLTALGVGAAGLYFSLRSAGHETGGHAAYTYSFDALPVPSDNQNNIIVGGNGDPTGQGAHAMLNTWPSDSKSENVELVPYPAEIAPKDAMTYNESTAIGADHLADAINNTPGEKTVYGYSQGTVVVGNELSKIAAENGGKLPDDINSVYVSSPNTAGTGFHETIGGRIPGVMNMFGIDPESGKMPLGDQTTIIGQRGDGISNMPDPLKNPVGSADALVGYLSGRHDYSNIDPSQITSRVADDGTTYLTVHPKSGINSPALDLAQRNGFFVSRQAIDFADAIAPQVDTGDEQPTLDPIKIAETGSNLLEDSINRALPEGTPQIDLPTPDIIPTPAPVISSTPDVAAVAPIQDIAPQVQQAVESVTQAVSQVAPNNPQVAAVSKQAQDFVNNLIPHL